MPKGRDQHDQASNVISLAGSRRQAKIAKGLSAGEPRVTAGQWLTSAMLVMLAIGGVFALVVPLLRAAGMVGG